MRSAATWLAHLRAGGTTPWAAYDGGDPPLPLETEIGAQQLEVLRRLNELGRVSPALADRVIRADLSGRGHGLLRLAGDEAGGQRRFGTPPVDPSRLPYDELIRPVLTLLAEDVAGRGAPERPVAPRRRRGHPAHRLAGDPLLVDAVRSELDRLGRPEGGEGAVTYVLARALPTMLAATWTWRALADRAPAWEDWLAMLERTGRLPAEIDLAQQARSAGGGMRIVLDPALLPGALGVDGLTAPHDLALGADAAELARLVTSVVGLHAGDATPDLMIRGFAPRLAGGQAAPLAVPEQARAWVDAQARLLRDTLLRGSCDVLGEPDLLLAPPTPLSGRSPQEPAVLDLALRTLLEGA